MSDPGRKPLTDRARESIIPEESKPLSQKIKEAVTDTGDRIAQAFQPKETKSVTQQAADGLRNTKDRANSDVEHH